MKAQITVIDNNGHKHTWLFMAWCDMREKFMPGDKIKILFNDVKIYDGIFEMVANDTLYVRKEKDYELTAFPLASVTGVHKPKD